MASEAGIHHKKQSLFALEPLLGKSVHVLCTNFRTVRGVLSGFDSNMNLVLANAQEDLQSLSDPSKPRSRNASSTSRHLGAVILRGAAVEAVHPSHLFVEIPNPF
jgi:small nuclear ribonucleoprotein (snRNP)-like protein